MKFILVVMEHIETYSLTNCGDNPTFSDLSCRKITFIVSSEQT